MNAIDGHPPNARNKANYIAAKAAYNARELDHCLTFYAREHQIMSRPAPPGREHIRAFLEGTIAGWPDLRLEVAHAVAEDDWVMGRCVVTATHTTAVMGVPPTGKQVVTTFWDLHRFDEAGLIVQTWNLMDSLALMQQLGLLPASGGAPMKAPSSDEGGGCSVARRADPSWAVVVVFALVALSMRARRRFWADTNGEHLGGTQ